MAVSVTAVLGGRVGGRVSEADSRLAAVLLLLPFGLVRGPCRAISQGIAPRTLSRWSPSRQGYVVEVGLDYGCAGPLLAFAAERGITVDPDAAAMLARRAQRQAETAAAHAHLLAELDAWNARPPRPLAEVRRVVGPVVYSVSFYCFACEREETAWASAGRFPVALYHLPTLAGPRRITEEEAAALLDALGDPRAAGAPQVSPAPVSVPAPPSAPAARRPWRLRRAG